MRSRWSLRRRGALWRTSRPTLTSLSARTRPWPSRGTKPLRSTTSCARLRSSCRTLSKPSHTWLWTRLGLRSFRPRLLSRRSQVLAPRCKPHFKAQMFTQRHRRSLSSDQRGLLRALRQFCILRPRSLRERQTWVLVAPLPSPLRRHPRLRLRLRRRAPSMPLRSTATSKPFSLPQTSRSLRPTFGC
eukprot:Amastigsp_a352858_4.p1 type:complete len:187 gc:universal Amastigsp_a352858_4:753-193(-)